MKTLKKTLFGVALLGSLLAAGMASAASFNPVDMAGMHKQGCPGERTSPYPPYCHPAP